MLNFQDSFIYDIETFPNVFTLSIETFHEENIKTFEISEFLDEREELFEFINWCAIKQVVGIGFNNIGFDYPILHYIMKNPSCSVQDIFDKASEIINSEERFSHNIWASDRIFPQIDLYKVYHMDNHAKSTTLKALQINMRSKNVWDLPFPVGTNLTEFQIRDKLIPYNQNDVAETKKFALVSKDAINFRISLIDKFGVDVLNWSDTKIGSKIMEKKLGEGLCFDKSSGSKKPRQTYRKQIALKDIIFPYVKFENPEFQKVHEYLKEQVLKGSEIEDIAKTKIKTKGVFTNLKAHINGFDFHFGTGGIHGSVSSECFVASKEWLIVDVDVASLYPSIAIVNKIAPEHLGQRFHEEYSNLPKERKRWQEEKGKKCVEANALKLASNGVFGNSNSEYSVFYDPQFTISITLNGQLMLCMLAEKLLTVPTLKIIQINTDGITYYINKEHEEAAKQICADWQEITKLVLEENKFKRAWVRDVNNYIMEDYKGELKLKGVYWTPDDTNYFQSISEQQPPAWHKDLSNLVSVRAAVEAMVNGTKTEDYIKKCTNPHDLISRIKARGSDKLLYGEEYIQKTNRYFVSKNGLDLIKISPPTGYIGEYKKKNGVTQEEYERVMTETGGEWDERVCTKNKSKYEERRTAIEAGYKVKICNKIEDFSFEDIDYDWYIQQAEKLII